MPLDRAERWESPQSAISEGLNDLQTRIFTQVPVKITSIANLSTKNTISVQPLVMRRIRKLDSSTGQLTWQNESWPEISEVPVKFPSGGGWTTTFPLKVGDEGTIHGAMRSIDNWWDKGGEQPMVSAEGTGSLRMHSPSDSFFIPGGRSKPNAVKNVSTDHVETRSDDGKTSFKVGPTGFTVTFDGKVVFAVDKEGNVKAKGDVTMGAYGGDNIHLSSHKHAGVMTGGGNTLKPVRNS